MKILSFKVSRVPENVSVGPKSVKKYLRTLLRNTKYWNSEHTKYHKSKLYLVYLVFTFQH